MRLQTGPALAIHLAEAASLQSDDPFELVAVGHAVWRQVDRHTVPLEGIVIFALRLVDVTEYRVGSGGPGCLAQRFRTDSNGLVPLPSHAQQVSACE
jgi:hypothetical protein